VLFNIDLMNIKNKFSLSLSGINWTLQLNRVNNDFSFKSNDKRQEMEESHMETYRQEADRLKANL